MSNLTPRSGRISEKAEKGLSIFIIFIIIVIVILIIAACVVYRSRRLREQSSGLVDEPEDLFTEVKDGIIFGHQTTTHTELSMPGMEELLEDKHASGEISDVAYDYIKTLLGDNEEESHGQIITAEKPDRK